jgi:hypothetical protein
LKFAVTVLAAFMVTLFGFVVPVRSPANPLKLYPDAAVAVMAILLPDPNQPPDVIDPPAGGLTAVVSKCCVVNVAVYVAGLEGVVTVCVTAPPSDQLANARRDPAVTCCGSVVES